MMVSKNKFRDLLIGLGYDPNDLAHDAKVPRSIIPRACKGEQIDEEICIKLISTINKYNDKNYHIEEIFKFVIKKPPSTNSRYAVFQNVVFRCAA